MEIFFSNLTETTDSVAGRTFSIGRITLLILVFLICLWIIIINGLLIACFWINRGESWCSQSKNILSIIIIDFLDGLSTLLWFLVSFKTEIARSICMTSVGFSLASHSAASLNILRVCVTRLRYITRTPQKHDQPTSKVILQTILIWLIASVLVMVPLVFWTGKQTVLNGCHWKTMFSTHEASFNTYMVFMLAVPTVITTVLYAMLVRKLRRLKNLVQPLAESSSKNMTRELTDPKAATVNKTLFPITIKATTNIADNPGNGPERLRVKPNVPLTECILAKRYNGEPPIGINKGKLTTMEASDVIIKNALSNAKSIAGDEITAGSVSMLNIAHDNAEGASTSMAVNKSNQNVAVQRNRKMSKVIIVLGISLVLINIANLPFTVFLFLKAINPETEFSASLAALSLFFLMFNSASNVFVYAVQLGPLRKAVLKMLRNALSTVSRVTRCHTRVNPT